MSQNAGPTWNDFHTNNHFDLYPQSATATFEEAYNGDNFQVDFKNILLQVAQVLNTKPPIWAGDDEMNASLENWPSH